MSEEVKRDGLPGDTQRPKGLELIPNVALGYANGHSTHRSAAARSTSLSTGQPEMISPEAFGAAESMKTLPSVWLDECIGRVTPLTSQSAGGASFVCPAHADQCRCVRTFIASPTYLLLVFSVIDKACPSTVPPCLFKRASKLHFAWHLVRYLHQPAAPFCSLGQSAASRDVHHQHQGGHQSCCPVWHVVCSLHWLLTPASSFGFPRPHRAVKAV